MTIANLLSVRIDEGAKKIVFSFEEGAATKEVLRKRTTEVAMSVKSKTNPDMSNAIQLSRLLLPEKDLETMQEHEFIAHAKKTAGIFKQSGLAFDWFKKLQQSCVNVAAKQSYEQDQKYWNRFNDFLVIIEKQYTGDSNMLDDYLSRL